MYVTTVPQTLTFLSGQARYLKARGFEVIAVSSPGDELQEFARLEGIKAYGIEMSRRITPARDGVALWRLYRLMRRLRPQIVHAASPKGGLLGITASWLARVPVRVYHMLGLPYMTAAGMRRRLLRATERVSCVLSNQVLCLSNSLMGVAVKEGLCPAEKVKVLGNGNLCGTDAVGVFSRERAGSDTRRLIRQRYGIPEDSMVIGYVGRVVRDKGMFELAGAWKRLRERMGSLHLLIVGAFEPQDPVGPEIEELFQEDRRIHLTGFVRDTPSYYAAMDVVVFPTYREGFGTIPIEANAMELPVVATRIPGCLDSVVDGVTGTLVPVRDAAALAGAVETYLCDPALRQRHGSAGRERVLRDFRPEIIWNAVDCEYRRLLAERRLPGPLEVAGKVAAANLVDR